MDQEPFEDVCRRTGAEFDVDSGQFLVPALGGRLAVTPRTRQAEWIETSSGEAPGPASEVTRVAALTYLLSAQDVSREDEWIGPVELPSGDMFFRGVHSLPTADLEAAFGASTERFRAAAEALGGTPLAFADMAYRLPAFPHLAVAVLLWLGDDEFPARVRFLVDRFAGRQLPLDGLLAVLSMVVEGLLHGGEGLR